MLCGQDEDNFVRALTALCHVSIAILIPEEQREELRHRSQASIASRAGRQTVLA
jgi:hypothetical protein